MLEIIPIVRTALAHISGGQEHDLTPSDVRDSVNFVQKVGNLSILDEILTVFP